MILIVDDKQENLFSLKTLLQLHSYKVDTASSGEEALKKILQNEYALIILDVQMPGMDGYEVAEAVTGFSKTKDIPIIFLSAVNIDKRFITKGYESGGVDYVTKPFDSDLLLLKVKTFYRLHEQTHDLKKVQRELENEIENRKQAQSLVENMNVLLEEKVAQRTNDLVRLNQDLQSRNAELGQYATLASHDLQEPLRKIITFIGIINEKYLQDIPGAQKEVQKISASAEWMRTLINDLLNYSNLSEQSSFTKVDLNEIVQTTLLDMEVPVSESEAEIIAGELPRIEAIAGQIRQMFQNIIGNAIKFSKKGKRPVIRIWGELIADKSLDSARSQQGEFARIQIQDNGIGFDEVYLDKIFTIFQRLHAREDYKGTGIGLAIVKKIIENHNGLISAVSREGEGTTFNIVLPLKQSAAKKMQE